MAVQIPTVQRMAPQAPTSVGRVEMQVPDVNAPMAKTINAVGNVAEGALKLYTKAEDDYADTVSTKAANDYDDWFKKKMYGDSETQTLGLVHIEGDPTDAYNQFDAEAKKKMQELSKGDYSNFVKNKINEKLLAKDASLSDSRLMAYGTQHAKYETGVSQGAVNLETQNASINAQHIRAGDESTLAPFVGNLSRIIEERNNYAVKVGAGETETYIDEETNEVKQRVVVSDATKAVITKDLSTATYNAVNVLVSADKVDEANMVMEKYGHLIDGTKLPKIEEKLQIATVKKKAYEALGKIDGVSYAQKKAELNKIKDPEVKRMAINLVQTQDSDMAQLQKMDSTENFNKLHTLITEKKQKGNAFVNVEQFKNDPIASRFLERVAIGKQRDTLYQMIESVNESDDSVRQNMYDLSVTEDFLRLDAKELDQEMVGLSDKHKNRFREIWRQQKTETGGETRSNISLVNQEVLKQWKINNLYKEGRKGEIKSSEQARLDFTDTIYDEVKNVKGMSINDKRNYIIKRVAEEKARIDAEKPTGFWSSLINKFSSAPKESAPTPAPKVEKVEAPKPPAAVTTKPAKVESKTVKEAKKAEAKDTKKKYDDLDDNELLKVNAEFIKAHGRKPKSAQEELDWYESKGK